MTWGARLMATGVIALVVGGLAAGAASLAGAPPAEPSTAIAFLATGLAAVKAIAAVAGLRAYAAARLSSD
jgi:hypothetical protein